MNNAVIPATATPAPPLLSISNLVAVISAAFKKPSIRLYLLIMAVSVAIAHLVLRRIFGAVVTSTTPNATTTTTKSSNNGNGRRSSSKDVQQQRVKVSSGNDNNNNKAAKLGMSATFSATGSSLGDSATATGNGSGNGGSDQQHQQQHRRNQQQQSSSSASSAAAAASSSSSSSRVFSTGYERLGHVVTVRVKAATSSTAAEDEAGVAAAADSTTDSSSPAFLARAAQSFANSMKPPVYVVLSDTAGVQGELRQPTHAPLWLDSEKALASARAIVDKVEKRGRKLGVVTDETTAVTSVGTFRLTAAKLAELNNSPSFTMHVEKGIRYSLDASRVMFSSGNTTERMHFGVDVDASQETVVDMFAGIGYFTVPLACSMHRPARIIAIEKNPESCAYLACNTLLNDCVDRVVILNGDNRQVGGLFVGKCNRVLMGYIPCCKEFLPRAVSFLVQKKLEVDENGSSNNNSNSGASRSPPPGKAVSFAPGSTPPREQQAKQQQPQPNSQAAENDDAGAAAGKDDDDQEDQDAATANAETASSKNRTSQAKKPRSPSKQNPSAAISALVAAGLTTRPVGVVHYHYLSESNVKQQAAAIATVHAVESLGSALASLMSVADVRVVKSYAPKKFHCVADFVFA